MNQRVIIYQVFTRLFGNRATTRKEWGSISENGCGKMADFTSDILASIRNNGVSHIWYTGLLRHATQTDYSKFGIPQCHKSIVKGIAGSPYAIIDYYDIDPDLSVDVNNRMGEFENLVKRTHQAKLKMIIDFVPNHVARQYHSIKKPATEHDLGEDDDVNMNFSPDNNFYYCAGTPLIPQFDNFHKEGEPYCEVPAKATGNNRFDNSPDVNDWYETIKLNYGIDYCGGRLCHFNPIPNTWIKMLNILLFWASKGVDGFRCDMAEMVPVEFWQWAISKVKEQYSTILFIGEVYNPAEYRNYIYKGGFDFLYDKVGMYDTLRSIILGNAPASFITGVWQSLDDIHDHMLFFLENHDEQRIASDFFAGDATKGLPALIVSLLLRQNPFMLYFGQEFGERGMDKEGFSGFDGRTTIFDYWSIPSVNRWITDRLTSSEKSLWSVYQRLLHIASTEKAVTDGEFFDLMYVNPLSWCFNPERQYAFLRKYGSEVLLVVVNFDSKDVSVQITIPQHAFDYLNIPQSKVSANDLLSGEIQKFNLSYDSNVIMEIKAYSGKVYKFMVKDGSKI
jgi:glycosidase